MIRAAWIAICLLTGCTSIQPPSLIADGEWRVTAINGRATPPPPASYRMRFEGNRLGGQFGCNHFGGDYRVAGDVLTTGAMMMTEMACSEPANSFEALGIAILHQPARVTWPAANRIMLTSSAGSIELLRQ